MIDFAQLTLETPSSLTPAGHLFVIQCEPDPFTRERINIGVCVVDRNGVRQIKMISQPGRLECLYGDSGSAVVLSLAQVAGACAVKGLNSPSRQVFFGDSIPFYNADPKVILESTFADQITVALPRRVVSTKKKLDDADVLKGVIDRIKSTLGLETHFLANTPQVLVTTERGQRSVTVPLQPENGVGTIRSAHYSPSALKSHLMDSLLDLECASRYKKKDHLGIFILRPKDVSEKEGSDIDAIIDGVAFRAPQSLYLEVQFEIDELAKSVTHWAEKAV